MADTVQRTVRRERVETAVSLLLALGGVCCAVFFNDAHIGLRLLLAFMCGGIAAYTHSTYRLYQLLRIVNTDAPAVERLRAVTRFERTLGRYPNLMQLALGVAALVVAIVIAFAT